LTYDDSAWTVGNSPFGFGALTIFGRPFNTLLSVLAEFYFRIAFVPIFPAFGNWNITATLYIASNDRADGVYLNGVLLDSDPGGHPFAFWNRIVQVPTSLLINGTTNVLAVRLSNTGLGGAFFAARLDVDKSCLQGYYPELCLSTPSLTTGDVPTTGSIPTTGAVQPVTTTSASQSTSSSIGVTSATFSNPTSGQPNELPQESSGGSNVGLIVGVVIAAIVVVLVVVGIIICVVMKKKKQDVASLIEANKTEEMQDGEDKAYG
jgi:hypothetical protein